MKYSALEYDFAILELGCCLQYFFKKIKQQFIRFNFMLAQWSYQNQSKKNKYKIVKLTFENQYCSHTLIQRYIDAKNQ